jgi:hypothetical protein
VVKAEENLLLQSQTLDNASWGNAAAAIVRTANTAVAPDGTTTADSWDGDGTAAVHYSGQLFTFISTAVYRFSIYAKPDGVNFIQLFTVGGTGYANFDITAGAGVVGTAAAPFSDLTIQDVGSGWYRCTCLITNSANNNIYISLSNSSTATRAATSFATSDGVYLWGAQLEQRSFATAYTATTTQTITRYQRQLKTAAANEWPREFDPVTGECLGRSVWESRTNLLQRSEEFDNAYWTKSNTTISANQVIAPDGTLSADIATTTSTGDGISRALTGLVANGTYTVSVPIKVYSGATWFRFVLFDSVSAANRVSGWFNATTGVVGSATNGGTGTGATVRVVAFGNGFYDFILSGAVNNSVTALTFQMSTATADLSTTGVSGVSYIPWGAQLEAGAFASPYIPTVAAQVTRVADSAAMTGTNFSSWFNPSEGTLFADATSIGLLSAAPIAFEIGDGTVNNKIVTGQFVSGAVRTMNVQAGNVTQVQLANTATPTNPTKAAGSYKFNDFAGSVNGGTVLTDTVGLVPVVDRAQIGNNASVSAQHLNGYIKRLTYYPQALTSANLQAITR